MALSNDAKKLFEYLPDDGTKVGGITVKKDFDWTSTQYQRAKDELRDEGLVAFGRGRGGSVARVEGKELPQDPTPSERMAHARAAKVATRRIDKDRHEMMDKARKLAEEERPDADQIDVSMYGTPLRPVITVWEGGIGRNFTLKGEEWACD